MKRMLIILAIMLALACLISGEENPTKPDTNYKIGDIGPAGGVIFYDKGEFTDGWRYLEVAPSTSEFEAQWGILGHNVSETQTDIGTGKKNTEIINAFYNKKDEKGTASQQCVSLIINDYDDWFLPSKDELYMMYQNLYKQGLGGFQNSWYWSSSQDQNITNYACNQYFGGGNQLSNLLNFDYRVRACRAF